MTFLNGLLAFGAAAFTVPLLIHLLHRSRFQVVEWGAMHLLQSSRNVNSKRVQWQQLLLLLLRCMLPILLALAMSRPLFQSWFTSGGQSPMSVAFIVDDSLSMFAKSASTKADAVEQENEVGESRLATACEAIEKLIEKLPSGSDAAIILAGEKTLMLNSHVPSELINRLEDLRKKAVPAGQFDLDASFRAALRWLDSSSNPKRQVIIATDFQSSDWKSDDSAKATELRRIANEQNVAPELFFLREGSKILSVDNLAVASITTTPTLVASEREVTIATTITNYGDTPCDSVSVAVYVNDAEVDRQQIKLAPKSSSQINSRWKAKPVGSNVVRARILRNDDLNADNVRSNVVVVQRPISILLVDGDRRNETMQSESDFLRLALSPFSLLQGEKGDLFVSKTIQPHELNEQSLQNVATVVLCNVPELSEPQQNWIRDFVKRGNGLIVFLGDRVRPEQYQTWPSIANNGLRICKYAARAKTNAAESSSAAPPTEAANSEVQEGPGSRLNTKKFDFGPINEMSAVSLNALTKTRFEYRMPLTLDAEAATAPYNARAAIEFEDGQPWVLQNTLGEGRCIWITTACDDDDSSFPSRPAYVPFMQKLVAFASGATSRLARLAPGEPWNFAPASLDVAAAANAIKVSITSPDGNVSDVELESDKRINFASTRSLGVYVAKPAIAKSPQEGNEAARNAASSAASSETALTIIAACNVDDGTLRDRESKLVVLDEAETKRVAKEWGASVYDSASDLANAQTNSLNGKEIWTWLWSALVICFLAEMALEQWLSPRLRSRNTSPSPALAPGGAS